MKDQVRNLSACANLLLMYKLPAPPAFSVFASCASHWRLVLIGSSFCLMTSVSLVRAENKEPKKPVIKKPAAKKPVVKDDDAPTAKKESTPISTTSSDTKLNDSEKNISASSANASIATEDLLEFKTQPAAVKRLIESGLDLARKNLTYTYGSADPANGGMDCSGFIYYSLKQHGFTQAPRDSSGLYSWVRRARGFRAVISRKADSFEMDELLPGDLLFWTGTYATDHDPPVSHVMIYIGTEKSTGAKVMLGSSDGRTYHGQKRNGVSVFDFVMPRESKAGGQQSTFVGYGRIPGLRE